MGDKSPKTEGSRKYLGCQRKNFYDTLWEAERQAAIQREHSGHTNIEAYKCLYCLGFHIGHQKINGEKISLGITKRCPKCKWVVKLVHYKDHMWSKHTLRVD